MIWIKQEDYKYYEDWCKWCERWLFTLLFGEEYNIDTKSQHSNE